MDSSKLNDWMQVVGIFAVVASLIFVGLQMKQSQEIALSQAFQARAETTTETLLALSEHESFISVILKQRQGVAETITEREKASAGLAMQAGMYLWENSYYQNRAGFLSDDHWNRTRVQIKGTLAFSLQKSIANGYMDKLRPEFRDELARILAEVREESGQ